MPVKNIEVVGSRVSFQDWNVRVHSSFPQTRRGLVGLECPGLKGDRAVT